VQKLKTNNLHDLAAKLESAKIMSLCNCGDPDCGSFYLMPEIDNENERNAPKIDGVVIQLGAIALETYENKPYMVEVLPSQYGREIRQKIEKAI
jgi:hypothetical protein